MKRKPKGGKTMIDSSLLFSAEPTRILNERVEKEIDNRLFLFLNYCPDYIIPPNYDGKYIHAVANLYSIFKDSAWIILSFTECFTGEKNYGLERVQEFSQRVNTRELKNIFDIVSDLRTIDSHTESCNDKILTARCEKWFSEVIKKKKPSTNVDFKSLLDKLNVFADTIVSECNKFIDEVKKAQNKEEIIDRWKNKIIDRYIIKQEMLKQALGIYIRSPCQEELTKVKAQKKINRIILSYFYYDYKQICELAETPRLPKEISDYLKEQAQKIEDDRITELKNISNFNISSLKELEKLKDNNLAKNLIDFFFNHKLRDLIEKSQAETMYIEDIACLILENTMTEFELPNGYIVSIERFEKI